DVNDGHFLVNSADEDKGDSGGPFYTKDSQGRLVVHGTLFGKVWEWAYHGKYTSVAFHLSWLLEKMDYMGAPLSMATNMMVGGTTSSTIIDTDWRRCALRCAETPTCKAYNHFGSLCYQLSSTSNTVMSFSGAHTGSR